MGVRNSGVLGAYRQRPQQAGLAVRYFFSLLVGVEKFNPSLPDQIRVR
jgi:hypothetical protein